MSDWRVKVSRICSGSKYEGDPPKKRLGCGKTILESQHCYSVETIEGWRSLLCLECGGPDASAWKPTPPEVDERNWKLDVCRWGRIETRPDGRDNPCTKKHVPNRIFCEAHDFCIAGLAGSEIQNSGVRCLVLTVKGDYMCKSHRDELERRPASERTQASLRVSAQLLKRD
jgi:hypothetical protein